MMEPRYLNSLVKSTNPTGVPMLSRTVIREVSAAEYSTRGGGKYIASVFEGLSPLPTCT